MALEAEKRGRRSNLGRRLVLFPLPFQGHINPMFQLATLLFNRGFSITIVHTNFNAPDPTKYPDFRFAPIPDGLPDEIATGDDLLAIVIALNATCQAPFRDRMAKMLAEEQREADEPIACLVSDAIFYSTRAVAEELKLRRVVLRTSSAACLKLFAGFPKIWEKGYYPIQDPLCEAAVPEIPPYRVRDLLNFRGSSPNDIHELLTQVTKEIRASSGVVLNTFEDLESDDLADLGRELRPPIFPIGPLHKLSSNASNSLLAHDLDCMEWLDEQAPMSVMYVSFGSLACMGREELVETAWGLADTRRPFLWVIRPGSVRGGGSEAEAVELPEGFEEETRERGRVVGWAPQQEVLAHPAVGGFWTHCGWNSIMESTCEGVPMLCRPYFGDQTGNARYVSHVWKVGIQLEKAGLLLERGEIERAVERLMVEKEGEEMRERMRDLKLKAQHSIKEGGSSYDSLNRLVDLFLSS